MVISRKPGDHAIPDTHSNPIEWAAHYWNRNEIEGDENRFLTLNSLQRYHRTVSEIIERELREHELNITDYFLLMTLELSESGTRLISSLARNLMVHPTTATLATDRLEGRSLLSRSPHPTDRRAICVTITDAGKKLAHDATVTLDSVDFGLGSNAKNVSRLFSVLDTLRDAVNTPQVREKATPPA